MHAKKIFISHNYVTFISYFFILIPLIGGLFCAFEGMWSFFAFSFFLSYCCYSCGFHRCIRLIILKDGNLKAFPSLTLVDQVQYKVTIPLSDITTANYSFLDKNSKGDFTYTYYTIPCIIFKKRDGCEEIITIAGYTKKQIASLEKSIKGENKNIEFKNNYDFFISQKNISSNEFNCWFFKKGVKFVFLFQLKYIEGKLIDYFL